MTSRMPCAAGRCFSATAGAVLIQNPPAKPLTTEEMDHVYALPYMRTYHPSYEALGGVPAIAGGSVFYHSQPRLLRRVQFLRA